MNIDEDDFSDEYDFMDEDDEAQNTRRQSRKQASAPQLKYMDVLRKVSDRYADEVTIDLDDLAKYDESLEESGTPLNLVTSIETNAKHYLDIFSQAVDNVMPPPTRDIKSVRLHNS